MRRWSDHLLDVPDEGADAHLFVTLVEFADGEEQFVDFVVGDDGDDGVVHLGPGVGAAMGVAVDVAAALYVLPLAETADAEGVEHVFHALVVGLVVDYHYGFHGFSFFREFRESMESKEFKTNVLLVLLS